jgi:hypothetical protein
MEEYYIRKFNIHHNTFKNAMELKMHIEICGCFFYIAGMDVTDGGCGCCNTKYKNIHVNGHMYHHYIYGGQWKYKKYPFYATLSPYYLMCKKFDGDPKDFELNEDLIDDFEFKCTYNENKYLNEILNEDCTCVIDIDITKNKNSYTITYKD